MGIFNTLTSCERCGSKEHSTSNCPHERTFLTNERSCSHCGSIDHNTSNCPHDNGILYNSNKCRFCGSREHSSSNCPHERGVFSHQTSCRNCGSVDHASSGCPHSKGIFENDKQCRHCGSKNHSSSNCPQKRKFSSSGGSNFGQAGCIIMALIVVFAVFFGFLLGSAVWAYYIRKNGQSHKRYFGSLLVGVLGAMLMYESYKVEIPWMAVVGVFTNIVGILMSSLFLYKYYKGED